MKALNVFLQKDGEVTKHYYAELCTRGPAGELAVALFRAQKRSEAAKSYRGGKYRRAAYDVKNWSVSEICRILNRDGESALVWGWQRDPSTPGYEWVLYVELPSGQVSFHSAERIAGPDFSGEWDGQKLSRERIVCFCDSVLNDLPCMHVGGFVAPVTEPLFGETL